MSKTYYRFQGILNETLKSKNKWTKEKVIEMFLFIVSVVLLAVVIILISFHISASIIMVFSILFAVSATVFIVYVRKNFQGFKDPINYAEKFYRKLKENGLHGEQIREEMCNEVSKKIEKDEQSVSVTNGASGKIIIYTTVLPIGFFMSSFIKYQKDFFKGATLEDVFILCLMITMIGLFTVYGFIMMVIAGKDLIIPNKRKMLRLLAYLRDVKYYCMEKGNQDHFEM